MLKFNFLGKVYNIKLKTDRYANNKNLYIGMDCYEDGYWEPFGDITVNLSMRCKENCGFVDVNNLPGIDRFIKENNLGRPTGIIVPSGWVMYPEYKFNMVEIQKYCDLKYMG